MLKPLPLLLTLLLTGAAQAKVEQLSLEGYRQQSRNALSELLITRAGAEAPRERAILAVVQAPNNGVDEQVIESLTTYREQHPDDLYAKLYEGYGWLFTAGEYLKQQNYFRAAELAKRGFFLMDEAVDQDPENWRLRFLRARLDLYVPAEFGRHVVALKDLRYLEEHPEQVPSAMADLLDFLNTRALAAAGQEQQAEQLRQRLARSPLWAELLQQEGRLFLTAEEIQYVLAPIVRGEP